MSDFSSYRTLCLDGSYIVVLNLVAPGCLAHVQALLEGSFAKRLKQGEVFGEFGPTLKLPEDDPAAYVKRVIEVRADNIAFKIEGVWISAPDDKGQCVLLGQVRPMGPKRDMFVQYIRQGRFMIRGVGRAQKGQDLWKKISDIITFDFCVTTQESSSYRDRIAHQAAERFLAWQLPHDFSPDAYISFDRDKARQSHCVPTGTNLLTMAQAKAMFAHCLDCLVPLESETDQLLRVLGLEPSRYLTPSGQLDLLKVKTTLRSLSEDLRPTDSGV